MCPEKNKQHSVPYETEEDIDAFIFEMIWFVAFIKRPPDDVSGKDDDEV